jgi:uncharacterized membrane protein YbhN (UPF0104 family)
MIKLSAKAKKNISIILTVIFLFIICIYIFKNWSQFSFIGQISWFFVVAIIFLELICLFLQGIVLKLLVLNFGLKLKIKEWFGLTVATTLGNYIFPFVGLGFRAAYLKKRHQFDYTHFVSTIGAVYVIQVIISSVGGLISLLFMDKKPDYQLVIILSSLLMLGLTFSFFSPKLPKLKNRYLSKLILVVESWYKIKKNYKLVFQLFLLMLGQFLLTTGMFYLAYHSINQEISLWQSLLPACLSTFSVIFRLTPAAIGVYEGLVIYSSYLLNVSLSQGVIIAALTRFATMFWGLTLGSIFSYLLIYRSRK